MGLLAPSEFNMIKIHKLSDRMDEQDERIVQQRGKAMFTSLRPLVGDFLRFADGTFRRIAYVWCDGVQPTSDVGGASFYLKELGGCFSGGLDTLVPKHKLGLSEHTEMGRFWIFHHNDRKAHNGVDFMIPCKVWNVDT